MASSIEPCLGRGDTRPMRIYQLEFGISLRVRSSTKTGLLDPTEKSSLSEPFLVSCTLVGIWLRRGFFSVCESFLSITAQVYLDRDEAKVMGGRMISIAGVHYIPLHTPMLQPIPIPMYRQTPDEQGKVVFRSASPKKVVFRDMLHSKWLSQSGAWKERSFSCFLSSPRVLLLIPIMVLDHFGKEQDFVSAHRSGSLLQMLLSKRIEINKTSSENVAIQTKDLTTRNQPGQKEEIQYHQIRLVESQERDYSLRAGRSSSENKKEIFIKAIKRKARGETLG